MASKHSSYRRTILYKLNRDTGEHWTYRGRNGSGQLVGIELTPMGEYTYLSVINSRGPSDSATIDIPDDILDELIYNLMEIRKQNADAVVKLKTDKS